MSKEKIYEDAEGTSVTENDGLYIVYYRTAAGLASIGITSNLPSGALDAILSHRDVGRMPAEATREGIVRPAADTEPPPAEEPKDNEYYSTMADGDDSA